MTTILFSISAAAYALMLVVIVGTFSPGYGGLQAVLAVLFGIGGTIALVGAAITKALREKK